MRDVPWGWLVRYMHSTGASAFFIVVYLHMYRGLIYGSYRKPRELVWIFGCAIFLCLMAEAFMGYLLPWGQMSYWGAQVIVNLFSSVPFIGPDLSILIRGDYVVSDATLNRFFALHVIAVPLVLIGLVAAHILALQQGREHDSRRQEGRHVLHRMDGDVDAPVEQRFVQAMPRGLRAQVRGARGVGALLRQAFADALAAGLVVPPQRLDAGPLQHV